MFRSLAVTAMGLMLVLLLGQPCGAAMKNEPKDFRGTVFGQETAPGPEFACESDSEDGLVCVRTGDDLHLYDVPLRSLSYLFMYKRLYTVDMEVDGREAYDALMAALTARHGKPAAGKGATVSYEGTQVDILVYYDAHRRVGEISYVFKNLPCPVGE